MAHAVPSPSYLRQEPTKIHPENLKSGVIKNGRFQKSYEGTPQEGIISPTLANVYLHYVLNLWFETLIKKGCKGKAYTVRYADDFVWCFEYKEEAKAFYRELKERLAKFKLEMADGKSKILYFGKQAYLDRKAGME